MNQMLPTNNSNVDGGWAQVLVENVQSIVGERALNDVSEGSVCGVVWLRSMEDSICE